jgi:hypothetical protein
LGGGTGCDPEEVAAVAEAILEGDDLARTATTAQRALVLAQQAERKANIALQLLGVTGVTLPTDKDGVRALFEEARDLLEDPRLVTEAELLRWGKIFFQLTEEYLRLIAKCTRTRNAWTVLSMLGEKMSTDALELTSDHRYVIPPFVQAARRHLVAVAYAATHRKERFRCTVPTEDIDDAVISLLYAL